MGDLISRKALLEKKQSVGICDPYGDFYGSGEVIFADDIEKAPAVGAVEVVRCKDCKHYGRNHSCFYHSADEGGTPIFVRDNDFCSYGERRENETDRC